ncbi:MAG: SDR family NAD(P)-dependent oxidoreductase, partial [Janthinobacterium sp.]|nr:SDR family NAD(P)-dependent oxidoreductase [Janthinobacterium sp.]
MLRQYQQRRGGVAPAHPLVQRNTSDFAEQRYSSTWDGQEFFLCDHVVKGQKVLPGVAYLEMAREALVRAAGAQHAPTTGVRLRNVVWARPVIVGDAPVHAHIGLSPGADDVIAYEIYVSPDNAADAPLVCSRGLAEFMTVNAPPQDIAALRQSCVREHLAADVFYDIYASKGLVLGAGLRAVQELFLGEDVVLARLNMPEAADPAGYLLHPSMMDAVVTASVGLHVRSGRVEGPLALPFALQELEVFGAQACSKEMWAVARLSPGSTLADRVRNYDLDLCNDAGQIVARFKGFSTRLLDSGVAGQAPAPQTLLLQPTWRAAPAMAGAEGQYAAHLVLLCGDAIDAAALGARLGARCERLPDGYAAQAAAVLTALQGSAANGPTLLQVVVPASGTQQLSAGLAGLLRTARLENPALVGQLLMLTPGADANADAGLLAAKLGENARNPQDVYIRYAAGERQVPDWRELGALTPAPPWKDGAVYLITGGLGGLGRLFATEIATCARRVTLVITGRRSPAEFGESEQQQIRALETLDATVEYRMLDVADAHAVRQLVLQVEQEHAALNGIVHCAGVLRDSLVINKTGADLAAVLAPKVAGLVNLDEASRESALDCFLCFSSLAAVRANAGQADYAAANAFMDSYAAYRNSLVATGQRRGHTLSLNWPLWQEGGMQLAPAIVQAMAEATGLQPLRTASGIDALYRALASGCDQVAVMEGDAARIGKLLLSTGAAPAVRPGVLASPAPSAAAPAPAPLPAVAADATLDKVTRMLSQSAARLLKLPVAQINGDAELSSYGFDSLMLAEFVNRLNQQYEFGLAPTVFFEYTTLNSFARHMNALHGERLVRLAEGRVAAPPAAALTATALTATAPAATDMPAAMPEPSLRRTRFRAPVAAPAGAPHGSDDPVVIIGMSGCFPMADDIDAFWRNLVEQRTCISQVPPDRWNWRDYYGDPQQDANKTNITLGGFIDGVGHFDPLFFGISPKEAEMMDPQQRLLMLHVWNCIEDAGYAPASLAGSNTAIFAGTASTGYSRLVFRAQMAIEGYLNTGAAPSVGPNRMSYFLDLHGPSEPVETACSSALVALRRGVLAIESGESDLALVGGVNTIVNPDAHVSFSKAGMLCEDGRCKTFSAEANGYVRGEGAAMLLLKRLSAAERDGDHIYGVVRGTAQNHGGRASSLTAPNPRAQAELIKDAFRSAGVDPRTVGYMEAHGTGTPLGDPVEVNGLKMAFRDLYAATGGAPASDAHCGIGSVKTNIGHLEMAAGAAGVIKVLLQMRHKTLVSSLHCETVNPYIDLAGSPFYIVREAREWTALPGADGRPLPRRAGVSSFGFGGVNAHVLLEEYVPKAPPPPVLVDDASPALVVLSARNAERLQDRVARLREAIERGEVTQDNLADAAYTLQIGREAMDVRLALVVTSIGDLTAKLDAVLAGATALDDVYHGVTRLHKQELAPFLADEEAARMLEGWLARGKYGKLLDLWTKGLPVDWQRLHADRTPRRLRLPVYPFARERYWVPDIGATPLAASPSGAGRELLHPLLHCNTSTLEEQRFTTRFTGGEWFLSDHLVNGGKVLPGVAHLEMARAAVAQALGLAPAGGAAGLPVTTVHLDNIVFARPMLVGEAGLEMHVGIYPDANGLAYALYRQDGADGERLVYSEGRATLGAVAETRLDLASLRAACAGEPVAPTQLYRLMEEKGLTLGPGMQAIEALYPGDSVALARLVMPASVAAEMSRYLLHPSMLDAAAMTSVGLLMRASPVHDRLALPFALASLDVAGPCQAAMWAVARRTAGASAAGPVLSFDLDLCDDTGLVCVRLRGLALRTVGQEEVAGAALTPVETLLLQPQWRAAAAVAAGTQAPAFGERLILICDGLADSAELAARLGVRCERLPTDYAAQAEALLALLQTLQQQGATAPVLIQLLAPASGLQQTAAALSAMFRTARLESPKLLGQVIVCEHALDVGQLAARLEENSRSPGDVHVRYVQGRRQVPAWQELADIAPRKPWKDGGVYLITGGLGGLGLIVAREIAEQASAVTLVLTGRRALEQREGEAGRQAIRALEALGACVEYQVLDVGDGAAVRLLMLQVQERHETLSGIVHSAGIVHDGLLSTKTPATLHAVLAAKVAGLLNLDEASRDVELDFFICFSSLTALLGNVGQADYAAANAFQDAYAGYRNGLVANAQRHGRTLSVNWPLWQEGGMQVDAATLRAMAHATGMAPLRTAGGIAALYRAYASGLDQVAVAEGDATRMRQWLADAMVSAPVHGTALPPAAPAATAGGSTGSTDSDTLARPIRQVLVGIISAQAKVNPAAIKGDVELNQYGFDSIMLTDLRNRLNREFQLDLTATVLFEYPTLDALAQYLGSRHGAQFRAIAEGAALPAPAPMAAMPPKAPHAARARFAVPGSVPAAPDAGAGAEPIAIISLAGRFPQADDLDTLWDNLCASRDGITEVPAARWDSASIYDPQPGRLGKSSSKWGGFIDGIDQFDAAFFQISPRDALSLDPQVRLFLQTAWTLLEQAGYTRESLRRRHQGRVGVYVGAMAQPTHPADDGEQATAGLSSSSAIANQVSYFFNFEGPSLAIDTMCSSAMMALHLACRDLQQGECELAVVGGVCLQMSPQKYLGMSQARLYGSDPAHRSFSDGDGFQPAETVGAVLLKPLSKALADNDPIMAVVKGTAVHHSGRSNGYAAPNPRAQAEVMAKSLRRAGAGPDRISWIEAAATGTAVADAVEMAALGTVFGAPDARPVPVGAVKSNFGHAEHASGIAQLAKVVLQLKHRQLAPLLPIAVPNPALRSDDQFLLLLQRELAPWPASLGPHGETLPRLALINSFAAGGTCVSIVIGEHVPDISREADAAGDMAQLFVFSARTDERLRALISLTLDRLHGDAGVSLCDLAYTLQVGREAFEARVALVATTHAELCALLRTWLDGRDRGGAPLFCSARADVAIAALDDALVPALLAGRDLSGLAQCWVRGAALPWTQLHGGQALRRIAWVGYPFAPTVYPIDYAKAGAVRPVAPRELIAPAGTGAIVSDALVMQALAAALGMTVAALPREQPLQALGYNSIAALDLKYRLEAALQRPVDLALLRDVRLSPTTLARQLAVQLAQQADAGAGSAHAAALPMLVARPDQRYQTFALTDMQEAFLLGRDAALGDGRVGALIYLEIEVAGALDIVRLNQAWNRLIARHEMLCVVFDDAGQRVLSELPDYRCKVVDFRIMEPAERQARAGQMRASMTERVFEGHEWPLFDIRVAIHGEDRYRIHFSIDELIVD